MGPLRILLYLIGILLVVAGVAYGAYLAGVPLHWIYAGAAVIVGLGIAGAASRTRVHDVYHHHPPDQV
jgi:hypothetical protein